MAYKVLVTGPAKDDIWQNYRWCDEHRSHKQAARWFIEIDELIAALSLKADRHQLATELGLRTLSVHQVSFGIGRRPTHRVLYGIVGETVVVNRVRSLKQDGIEASELRG